tara:strand:- start:399 stop:680 length:282 start_codon:yes stop_codon:yes gene_type:complete
VYLLTLDSKRDDGAYAVNDAGGDKVLMLFETEDDAERYAMQLNNQEDSDMIVMEVDGKLAIKTCRQYNYKYAVITPNDIVIPPRSSNDNIPKD